MASIGEVLSRALTPSRPDPPLPEGIPAAVVVPLLDLRDPAVVFTKRTDLVSYHKGEISFPGGGRHPEDPDLLATALRETEEELGIPREAIEIAGTLPPTPTVATRYVIVPFVGILSERPEMIPSPVEIAEVIELRLERLIDVERAVEGVGPDGIARSWFAYELDGYLVWGATGRILHGLIDVLRKEGWT
ncbi:MAG TPA: CoA pyrophosphatase [Actinomycetota bacterium]|nr:CoA pyrophosphatase [Actinomycetota bacterium]